MTKFEDTTIPVCKQVTLEIKEVRGTSTMYTRKEGYEEVSSDTRTGFHWKLYGIASKLGPDVVASDSFQPKDQEVYDLVITSHGWKFGYHHGFKSREGAIRNAIAFAERNGMDVMGYISRTED